MAYRDEVKPDEFGEIRKIEAKSFYDTDRMLSGDLKPLMETVYDEGGYKREFPIEVDIEVTYDDYWQKWGAFNVPADDLKRVVDDWSQEPIYIQMTHGRNGRKDMWIKFIGGYEFMMNAYGYTKIEEDLTND